MGNDLSRVPAANAHSAKQPERMNADPFWGKVSKHKFAEFNLCSVSRDENNNEVITVDTSQPTVRAFLVDGDKTMESQWQTPFENSNPELKMPMLMAGLQTGQTITSMGAAADSILGDTVSAAAKNAMKPMIEVECKGSGFNEDNTPVILFERHVMRQRLIANDQSKIADQMIIKRPDLCSKSTGGYGLYSAQHGRLNAAAQYHRVSALESASWGIGQVMGYHWQSLGYKSLQAFINAMYRDEASQLDAMCRYIEVNSLINALKIKDWKAFARGYNGSGYAKNNYDVKLANAYIKWSAE